MPGSTVRSQAVLVEPAGRTYVPYHHAVRNTGPVVCVGRDSPPSSGAAAPACHADAWWYPETNQQLAGQTGVRVPDRNDGIVRNERSLVRFTRYSDGNPQQWPTDPEGPEPRIRSVSPADAVDLAARRRSSGHSVAACVGTTQLPKAVTMKTGLFAVAGSVPSAVQRQSCTARLWASARWQASRPPERLRTSCWHPRRNGPGRRH